MGGIGNIVSGIMRAVAAGQAAAPPAPPAPPPNPTGGRAGATSRTLGGDSASSPLLSGGGSPSSIPLPPEPPAPPPQMPGNSSIPSILSNLFGGNSSGGPPFGNNSGGFPPIFGGGFPNFGGGGMFEPVMLDLNGDGNLDVTGNSTAKNRKDIDPNARKVQFDMNGDGRDESIEWMSGKGNENGAGKGDGMLVDDSAGKVSAAAGGNGKITGAELFGDQDGSAHGFDKLKRFDKNGDGKVTADEAKAIKIWKDDGDGKVEANELRTLEQEKVNSVGTAMNTDTKNARGEELMRGGFVRDDGTKGMAEDVWFAGKKG